MCISFEALRKLYWSDLCHSDINAYFKYCESVSNGCKHVGVGRLDGSFEHCGGDGRGFDHNYCAQPAGDSSDDHGEIALVGGYAAQPCIMGTEGDGDCCFVSEGPGLGCGRIPVGGSVLRECGTSGGGGLQDLSHDGETQQNASVDGGSVALKPPRGPNFERNRANREAKKRRKQERAKSADTSDSKGFWNSCSPVVRQELIDSKARMHIADNNEKARKCELAAKKDSSVESLIREIIRISDLKEKLDKVPNGRVSDWAANVVSRQVETIASSAPSSVPSFDELSAKLAASSQSSFELSIKAKDDELRQKDNEIVALKKSLLQFEREQDDVLNSFVGDSAVKKPDLPLTTEGNRTRFSGVKFGDSVKQKISRSRYAHVDLATVKPNPMPMTPERLKQWNDNHISLTRAQVYEE